MYKNIKAFTLKELLILGISSVFMRLLNMIGAWHKYLPLKNEVDFFAKEGFSIIREKKRYWRIENINWGKIQIRPQTSDIKVVKQVLTDKEYMPLIELIAKYSSFEDVSLIIDAGANIGLTTIFLKKYLPKAKIIAIEPDKDNVMSLEQNVIWNSLYDVKVIKKAIWKNNTDILELSNGFRDGDFWSKSINAKTTLINESNKVGSICMNDIVSEYAGTGYTI